MKKIYISLLLLTLPNLLFAGQYPVIRDLTVEIAPGRIIYYFTQSVINLPNAETDIILPDGWTVGLSHKHYVTSGNEAPWVNFNGGGSIKTQNGMSLGQAAMAAYAITSGKTNIGHMGSENRNECIGYVAARIDTAPWAEVKYPLGTCLQAIPGKEWCKLVSPSLLLDHGTIKLTDDPVAAFGVVKVECSTGTRAKLSLSGSPLGVLDVGGGKASLRTSEGPLGTSIPVPAGQSDVTIYSILQGAKPGYWMASGTLIIEPM